MPSAEPTHTSTKFFTMENSPNLCAPLGSTLVQPTDSTHWGCRLDRSASWRKEPASHTQEAYIASRWGLKAAKELIVPTSVENQTQDAGALKLTKGEAADLISRLKYRQTVRLRALWIGLFYTMLTVIHLLLAGISNDAFCSGRSGTSGWCWPERRFPK